MICYTHARRDGSVPMTEDNGEINYYMCLWRLMLKLFLILSMEEKHEYLKCLLHI